MRLQQSAIAAVTELYSASALTWRHSVKPTRRRALNRLTLLLKGSLEPGTTLHCITATCGHCGQNGATYVPQLRVRSDTCSSLLKDPFAGRQPSIRPFASALGTPCLQHAAVSPPPAIAQNTGVSATGAKTKRRMCIP